MPSEDSLSSSDKQGLNELMRLTMPSDKPASIINECFSDLAGTVPAKPGDKVAAMKLEQLRSVRGKYKDTMPPSCEFIKERREEAIIEDSGTGPKADLTSPEWLESVGFGKYSENYYTTKVHKFIKVWISLHDGKPLVGIYEGGLHPIKLPTIDSPEKLLQLMALLGIATTATKQ